MRFEFRSFIPGLVFAALLATVPGLRAQGSPPMNTGDPGTPGNGHWELNFASAHVRTAAGHETELPIFDFGYGLGENLELGGAIAWLRAQEDGVGTESGLTNATVGLKWRFHDGGKAGLAAAIHPELEFNVPGSSSERKGLAQRGATFSLPVAVQRAFADFTVGVEVGRTFHFQAPDEWFYGVNVSHDFTDSLTLGVELFGEAEKRFDRSALLLNFGASVEVSPRHSLLVSMGRELHRHGGDKATFVGFLGWQVRL